MRELIYLLVEALPWLVVVIVALYLAARGELGSSLSVEQIVFATLALVGGIALAQLVDRLRIFNRIDHTVQKIDQELPLRSITGLAKFNRSRSESSQMVDWILGAHKEIFVVGGALYNTITVHGHQLINKANQGCKVRLLLMNPYTQDKKHRNPVAEAMGENYKSVDFCAAIENTLKDLENQLTNASENARKNFEVRLYNCSQTLSLMMVDDDERAKTGKMLVEFLIYGKRTQERPSIEFVQSHDSYKTFRSAYRYDLWQDAQIWFPSQK